MRISYFIPPVPEKSRRRWKVNEAMFVLFEHGIQMHSKLQDVGSVAKAKHYFGFHYLGGALDTDFEVFLPVFMQHVHDTMLEALIASSPFVSRLYIKVWNLHPIPYPEPGSKYAVYAKYYAMNWRYADISHRMGGHNLLLDKNWEVGHGNDSAWYRRRYKG